MIKLNWYHRLSHLSLSLSLSLSLFLSLSYMGESIFSFSATLLVGIAGETDLEFAKEYSSREQNLRSRPELRIDEAWLTINSTVNFNILLFSLNDQCWKVILIVNFCSFRSRVFHHKVTITGDGMQNVGLHSAPKAFA